MLTELCCVYRSHLGAMPACPKAMTYKSDFEQERADREKAVGKLEDQRLKWQADFARLDEQLRAQRYDECAALMVKLKSRTEAVVEVSNGQLAQHIP